MAQNFWTATIAWTVCFVVTILLSYATKRNKSDDELKGLVYSLTPRIKQENVPCILSRDSGNHRTGNCVGLNIIFW